MSNRQDIIAAMNDDELREQVAKLCGWQRAFSFDGSWIGTTDHKELGWLSVLKPIPNYVRDLNAMAEIEDTLSEEGLVSDKERFRGELMHVTKGSLNNCVHAKARARAEAFLATMEK